MNVKIRIQLSVGGSFPPNISPSNIIDKYRKLAVDLVQCPDCSYQEGAQFWIFNVPAKCINVAVTTPVVVTVKGVQSKFLGFQFDEGAVAGTSIAPIIQGNNVRFTVIGGVMPKVTTDQLVALFGRHFGLNCSLRKIENINYKDDAAFWPFIVYSNNKDYVGATLSYKSKGVDISFRITEGPPKDYLRIQIAVPDVHNDALPSTSPAWTQAIVEEVKDAYDKTVLELLTPFDDYGNAIFQCPVDAFLVEAIQESLSRDVEFSILVPGASQYNISVTAAILHTVEGARRIDLSRSICELDNVKSELDRIERSYPNCFEKYLLILNFHYSVRTDRSKCPLTAGAVRHLFEEAREALISNFTCVAGNNVHEWFTSLEDAINKDDLMLCQQHLDSLLSSLEDSSYQESVQSAVTISRVIQQYNRWLTVVPQSAGAKLMLLRLNNSIAILETSQFTEDDIGRMVNAMAALVQREDLDCSDLFNKMKDAFYGTNLNRMTIFKGCLRELMHIVRPLRVNEVIRGAAAVTKKGAEIAGNDVVLVLGANGSGKRLLLHFLSNVAMRATLYGEIVHISPVRSSLPESVTPSPFAISGVRTMNVLRLPIADWEHVFWCEVPGFGDVEISESSIVTDLCLSKFVKQARSVRLVVLVKGSDLEKEASEQFNALLASLYNFVANPSVLSISTTFIFSHAKLEEAERLNSMLCDKMYATDIPAAHLHIVSEMVNQAGNGRILAWDPRETSPQDILRIIGDSAPDTAVQTSYHAELSAASRAKVDGLLTFDAKSIKSAWDRIQLHVRMGTIDDAQNEFMENDVQLMTMKMQELYECIHIADQNQIREYFFNGIVTEVRQRVGEWVKTFLGHLGVVLGAASEDNGVDPANILASCFRHLFYLFRIDPLRLLLCKDVAGYYRCVEDVVASSKQVAAAVIRALGTPLAEGSVVDAAAFANLGQLQAFREAINNIAGPLNLDVRKMEQALDNDLEDSETRITSHLAQVVSMSLQRGSFRDAIRALDLLDSDCEDKAKLQNDTIAALERKVNSVIAALVEEFAVPAALGAIEEVLRFAAASKGFVSQQASIVDAIHTKLVDATIAATEARFVELTNILPEQVDRYVSKDEFDQIGYICTVINTLRRIPRVGTVTADKVSSVRNRMVAYVDSLVVAIRRSIQESGNTAAIQSLFLCTSFDYNKDDKYFQTRIDIVCHHFDQFALQCLKDAETTPFTMDNHQAVRRLAGRMACLYNCMLDWPDETVSKPFRKCTTYSMPPEPETERHLCVCAVNAILMFRQQMKSSLEVMDEVFSIEEGSYREVPMVIPMETMFNGLMFVDAFAPAQQVVTLPTKSLAHLYLICHLNHVSFNLIDDVKMLEQFEAAAVEFRVVSNIVPLMDHLLSMHQFYSERSVTARTAPRVQRYFETLPLMHLLNAKSRVFDMYNALVLLIQDANVKMLTQKKPLAALLAVLDPVLARLDRTEASHFSFADLVEQISKKINVNTDEYERQVLLFWTQGPDQYPQIQSLVTDRPEVRLPNFHQLVMDYFTDLKSDINKMTVSSLNVSSWQALFAGISSRHQAYRDLLNLHIFTEEDRTEVLRVLRKVGDFIGEGALELVKNKMHFLRKLNDEDYAGAHAILAWIDKARKDYINNEDIKKDIGVEVKNTFSIREESNKCSDKLRDKCLKVVESVIQSVDAVHTKEQPFAQFLSEFRHVHQLITVKLAPHWATIAAMTGNVDIENKTSNLISFARQGLPISERGTDAKYISLADRRMLSQLVAEVGSALPWSSINNSLAPELETINSKIAAELARADIIRKELASIDVSTPVALSIQIKQLAEVYRDQESYTALTDFLITAIRTICTSIQVNARTGSLHAAMTMLRNYFDVWTTFINFPTSSPDTSRFPYIQEPQDSIDLIEGTVSAVGTACGTVLDTICANHNFTVQNLQNLADGFDSLQAIDGFRSSDSNAYKTVAKSQPSFEYQLSCAFSQIKNILSAGEEGVKDIINGVLDVTVAQPSTEELKAQVGRISSICEISQHAAAVNLGDRVRQYLNDGFERDELFGCGTMVADSVTAYLRERMGNCKTDLQEELLINSELSAGNPDAVSRSRVISRLHRTHKLIRTICEAHTSSVLRQTIGTDILPHDVIHQVDKHLKSEIERIRLRCLEMQSQQLVPDNLFGLRVDEVPCKEYNCWVENLRYIGDAFDAASIRSVVAPALNSISSAFERRMDTLGNIIKAEIVKKKLPPPGRDGEMLFYDSVSLAKHFSELKSMSIYLACHSATIVNKIDKILVDSCEEDEDSGQMKIQRLVLSLQAESNKNQFAKMLLKQCHGLKQFGSPLDTTRFVMTSATSVLDNMETSWDGRTISNLDAADVIFLMENFNEYTSIYDDLVLGGLSANRKKKMEGLITTVLGIRDQNTVITDLPRVLANLFAYWTLKNAGNFLLGNEDGAAVDAHAQQMQSHLLKPNPGQVISILRMFQSKTSSFELMSQFAEIGTGEGKSVTLAMTSTILALAGFDVDCACYSSALSTRDLDAFTFLFEAFAVYDNICYGTFDKICQRNIDAGIPNGMRGLVRDIVTGEIVQGSKIASAGGGGKSVMSKVSKLASAVVGLFVPLESGKPRPKILLIDEVDVFFNKEFYGEPYIALSTIRSPEISALLRHIYDTFHRDKSQCTLPALTASEPYQKCLALYTIVEDWGDLLFECLKNMVFDVHSYDHPHRFENGMVGYDDPQEPTGISFTKKVFYKTIFVLMKEYETFGTPEQRINMEKELCLYLNAGTYSYAEIPKTYRHIMGVSGTLKTLNPVQTDLLSNTYNVKRISYMPSVYGDRNERVTTLPIKLSSYGRYFQDLVTEIAESLKPLKGNTRRPVLVFFESSLALDEFLASPALEAAGFKSDLHVVKEGLLTEQRDSLITQAVFPGKVSLFTRVFGRGTDFMVYDDSLYESGGCHVVQTFLSEELSEEIQIMGRTGRQGNNGSYRLLLRKEELETVGLVEPAIATMISTRTEYSTINDHRVAALSKQYEVRKQAAQALIVEHMKYQDFLATLRKGDVEGIKRFLFDINKSPYKETVRSKTMVLVDVTGSMGNCLQKLKVTIGKVFERAEAFTKDAGSSFQVQLGVYSNYNVKGNQLFDNSSWEITAAALRRWLRSQNTRGGLGNEAAELGLQHVHNLIESGTEVTQIILIGDAPPNTPGEVVQHRADFHGGERYWSTTKFTVATDYIQEVEYLKAHNCKINAFYIGDEPKEVFERIAAETGGQSGPLNVNNSNGADILVDIVTREIVRDAGGDIAAYEAKFPQRQGRV